MDAGKFSAQLLACEYHQPWEGENTMDEMKVHLLGQKTHIRSQRPKEVVQEIYGLLLKHWAVRSLSFQTASNASISPLRLSFTGTLRVVRRALPRFQRLQPQELPFFELVKFGDSRSNYTGKSSEKQPNSSQKSCFKISVETS